MSAPFRIALVTCPHSFSYSYERYCNSLAHFENLGSGYIAALLEQHGFETDFYNYSLDGLSTGELAVLLHQGEYSLIGFSVNNANALESIRIAASLPPQVHRCFGGYAASLSPHELLAHAGVDSVIVGEGEPAFLELARALSAGHDYEGIANLQTRERRNPLRPLAGLETLPFPSRRELADFYAGAGKDRERLALVSGSRGCHGNCSFCFVKDFYRLAPGAPVRRRSVEHLVDEIELLVRGPLQIEYIWFVDEEFIAGSRDRAFAFAAEMRRRDLCVPFEFDCRTDSVEESLFRELWSVGLSKVFLGIESFAQTFLDRVNKRTTPAINRRAIEVLDRLGIRYRLGMIFFDSGTTLAELCENVEVCYSLDFACINDPGRALKRNSLRGLDWEYPEAPDARQIFDRLHQEIDRQFAAAQASGMAELLEKKRAMGDYFLRLVRGET